MWEVWKPTGRDWSHCPDIDTSLSFPPRPHRSRETRRSERTSDQRLDSWTCLHLQTALQQRRSRGGNSKVTRVMTCIGALSRFVLLARICISLVDFWAISWNHWPISSCRYCREPSCYIHISVWVRAIEWRWHIILTEVFLQSKEQSGALVGIDVFSAALKLTAPLCTNSMRSIWQSALTWLDASIFETVRLLHNHAVPTAPRYSIQMLRLLCETCR